MNEKNLENINQIDLEFSGNDEDDSFVITPKNDLVEGTIAPIKTGVIVNFDDDDDIDIKRQTSNNSIVIPNEINQTPNVTDSVAYNEIDMECNYYDDTEEDDLPLVTKRNESMFDNDYENLDNKEFILSEDSKSMFNSKKVTVDTIEDDFWKTLSKKYNNDKSTIVEEISIDKSFKLNTAGYILEDGTFAYVEEYHGEDDEYRDLRLPEFSNTHPEEDTCIRIFNEPNNLQYIKLEEIIDKYLDIEGYCKIELWNDQKSYYFYKIYSLYEGACQDTSQEEVVRNWKGYDIIKIIKHNIKKLQTSNTNINNNIIEAKEPILKNILKDLQKKHQKSIKKGAMGSFHFVGNIEKEHEFFDAAMGNPKNTSGIKNSSNSIEDGFIGSLSAISSSEGSNSSTGGESGGIGESQTKKNHSKVLKEVFDIIGFDVMKDKDKNLIAKDLYNDNNTIKAKNLPDLIYALQPFLEICIIIPLSIYTGQNFNTYKDWYVWYNEENKKKYPKYANEIKYCDLLANHLNECEI